MIQIHYLKGKNNTHGYQKEDQKYCPYVTVGILVSVNCNMKYL